MQMLARSVLLFCALVASVTARAEVSAFGFTLGKTTYADVQSRGTPQGQNRYSDGAMLKLDDGEVSLEGLHSFVLIFDQKNLLAAMMLTIGKHRFDAVHEHLQARYRVRSSQIPFVGNRQVRYGAPGATILLDAPHLSFEMELTYMRDDFLATYNQRSREEAENKRRREAEQF